MGRQMKRSSTRLFLILSVFGKTTWPELFQQVRLLHSLLAFLLWIHCMSPRQYCPGPRNWSQLKGKVSRSTESGASALHLFKLSNNFLLKGYEFQSCIGKAIIEALASHLPGGAKLITSASLTNIMYIIIIARRTSRSPLATRTRKHPPARPARAMRLGSLTERADSGLPRVIRCSEPIKAENANPSIPLSRKLPINRSLPERSRAPVTTPRVVYKCHTLWTLQDFKMHNKYK